VDNPALVTDVEARAPRALTDDERRMAQALLDDGWEQVLARVPLLVERIDAGSLRVGAVVAVLRQAVLPVVLNPEGYLQESIDDWTGRRDASQSTGKLLLSDADLLSLQPNAVATSGSQAFEIVLFG
jgi:hypothetical protein